jgi:hypothetical protein
LFLICSSLTVHDSCDSSIIFVLNDAIKFNVFWSNIVYYLTCPYRKHLDRNESLYYANETILPNPLLRLGDVMVVRECYARFDLSSSRKILSEADGKK